MDLRTIAMFTGTRAEYGLLYPVLRAIEQDPRLDYRLLVGGSHLQEAFGGTSAEITGDGFQIHGRVDLPECLDTPLATTQAIGSSILGLATHLETFRPDFLVVYGDRFESLAAVIAGTQMNIPTAHIEGGDYTEGGALDDSMRHAMTKLAHLHFATHEQAVARILKLGEQPWRVFNVGLPSLDLIREGAFATPGEVLETLGLEATRPIVLFCQHSVTTEPEAASSQIAPSLQVLRRLAQEGWQVVVTYPNNDAGGRAIIGHLETIRGVDGFTLRKSLGRHLFHGLLNVIGRLGTGCLAGNSSAGIKETPAFGCPTVNIGSRQQGRLRAANVQDVPCAEAAIYHAILKCASDPMYRKLCRDCANPYGAGHAGPAIAGILASIPIDSILLQKKMTY